VEVKWQKLTSHSEPDGNAMASSVLSNGCANIVTHILFLDRLENQQKSGLIPMHRQLLRMDSVKTHGKFVIVIYFYYDCNNIFVCGIIKKISNITRKNDF